jgi:integrase
MLGAVRSVLSFAVAWGDLEVDPGAGLRVIKTSREELQGERRLPYSEADLALLFSPETLTEREKDGPASAWLPWLGLWTGARLSELTDLRVVDVKSEREITFLEITADGEDRRVKNSRVRDVCQWRPPVERGFLDYVEQRRAEGQKWLFDLATTSYGSRSALASKWYGRHARSLGITDKAKVFHSFRHLMLDALRAAGVEPEIRARLLGHEVEGMAGRYGTGHTLEQLRAALESVKLPRG